ncbi:MAG: ATP-dependent nuclease subunit B, partial [Oscillospiraceae bacterium]|nr:ATP-dependent nuclease subunit B [Oscillospiraceae bacterium]
MLKLYIGPAGSGKTAAAMDEIRARVLAEQPGSLLIVPEQYSHEAERELCRRCGDTMSRFAEVFSFSGLARRVLAEEGGSALPVLDKGGRLLCMTLALGGVGERLTAYRSARRRPEFPALMLSAADELKSAGVSAEQLQAAAEDCDERLGDKLRDAALVLEAYDAVVSNGRADPADRLTLLAQLLPACLGPGARIWVDGFIDFTGQEREILRAMLRSGAEVTVCLTLDALRGGDEIFALSRRAARSLKAAAEELGVPVSLRVFEENENKDAALRFFTERLFRFTEERFDGENRAIALHRAERMSEECEFAAARALELVRGGARWRDIAVAARGFEDYRPLLESVFRHYGVPLYLTRRSELLLKPLPALIAGAFEILESGWDVDDVTSYLRTGLTGLSADECDTLESYVFKWQLRASAWQRRSDWKQHPDGYGAPVTEESEARLQEINALRRRVAGPLLSLERRGKEASSAAGQAAALARYFEDLKLPETLEARAAALAAAGQDRLAAEYRQLWELIVSALEQFEAVLGETEMDQNSFGRLFLQMLSRYDVGTIPVSLDRVSAGDFDRMRRRSIRHLIVLGACDERLPLTQEQGGLFSDDERERLYALGIDLGGAGEEELWREFALIYHVLTLPSETLDLCYASASASGEPQRPAIVYKRAQALFGLPELPVEPERCRLAAPAPALTLAANALRGGDGLTRAAASYIRAHEPARMAPLEAAA